MAFDLCPDTPALIVAVSFEGVSPFCRFLRQARGTKDLFSPDSRGFEYVTGMDMYMGTCTGTLFQSWATGK
jgi:hypothetical protein